MSFIYLIALALGVALLALPLIFLARKLFDDWPGGALVCFLGLGLAGFFWEHYSPVSATLILLLVLAGNALVFFNRHAIAKADLAKVIFGIGGFLLACALPLAWRYAYPSIYPTSERVADLLFLSNFLNAAQLPPVDRWLPPYRFDFYYPLQFYLLGLIGRLFAVSPGILYNLGFTLICGACLYLVARSGFALTRSTWRGLWAVSVIALGGSGAAAYVVQQGYANGGAEGHNPAFSSLTALARLDGSTAARFFSDSVVPNPQTAVELPLEPFSYQLFIGDLHPTLGGLLLGFLLFSMFIEFEKIQVNRRKFFLLGGCISAVAVLMLAMNTWIVPLTAVVVGAWYLWKLTSNLGALTARELTLALALGAALALLLLLPFLAGMHARQLDTPVKWVTADLRGSFFIFILHFWPLIVLALIAGLATARNTLSFFWGWTCLALLLVSNLIYVDDSSAGIYERTNSTLKWWGWIWSVGLAGLVPTLLALRRTWITAAVIAATLPSLAMGIPLLDQLRQAASPERGRLGGDWVYLRNAPDRAIINYLRAQPDGISVEEIMADAYDDTGVLSLLGNKAVYLGWPSHEYTWRGNMQEIGRRRDDITALYKGTLPDPALWLRSNNIRYVVWGAKTCERHGVAGQTLLNTQLADAAIYHRLENSGDCAVGVWTLAPP